MLRTWSCECGQRWWGEGTVRACPKCGSAQVQAAPDTLRSNEATFDNPKTIQSEPATILAAAVPAPPDASAATLDGVREQTGGPAAEATVQQLGQPWTAHERTLDALPLPGQVPVPTLFLPDLCGGPAEAPGKGTVAEATPQPARRGHSCIEDYELLGVLGRGGMGIVHKARHIKLDRIVALKTILAGANAGPVQLARFQTEAEAVARLQHPNIVQIYDIGESHGQPFFALEFVDGGSLQRRLDGTPLAPRTAAELIATLARAVDYAHQRGIVHRDLKPANILLQSPLPDSESKERSKQEDQQAGTSPDTKNDPVASVSLSMLVPKITDFGLAKRTDDDSGHTGTGDILGTPSYMSPEQATGKNTGVGPAADIYALGAIFYDLLTGRPPFRGETVLDTLQQVQAADPLPPTRIQPRVPRDLETICLRCLEKEPGKRYGSAGALADDLQRFLDHKPILARPTPWWERAVKWARRRPAVAALLATLAVVVTGAFLGMAGLWREAEGERRVAEAESVEAIEARNEARQQRDRADLNLQQAFRAGDDLLSRVAKERLLKEPHMEGLRKELLLKALGFYESFFALEGGTPAVRFQAARAHRGVGQVQHELGNHGQAQAAYEKAVALLADLALEAPKKRDYRFLLAGTHNNLGVVLQAKNQPQLAEREYAAARRLLDELHSDYPLEVGYQRELAATFTNLASLLLGDPGRRKETEQAYGQALDWSRKLHREYPKDQEYQAELAGTLNSFSMWLLSAGQEQEAEKLFAESLPLWRELAEVDRAAPAYKQMCAVVLTNLAVVREMRHPGKAEESYREAIDLGEKLVRDYPRIADYRFNLAQSCTNLSLLLAREKNKDRWDDAAELRRKAMLQWQVLIERDYEVTDCQIRLIGCLQDEAMYQQRLGEGGKAIDSAEKAVQLRQTIATHFSERSDYQLALARSQVMLGELYGSNKKSAQEESNYRQALQTLDAMVGKAKPPPPGWTELMADVNGNLGIVPAERAEWALALPPLLKAMKYQREVWQQNKDSVPAQNKLANFSLRVVNAHVELKDHASASALAAEVVPVLRQLKKSDGGQLHALARLMARCLTMVSGEQHKKYEDQVVELLQASVRQGFRNGAALRAPLFESLQGRADYDKLVREVEKK